MSEIPACTKLMYFENEVSCMCFEIYENRNRCNLINVHPRNVQCPRIGSCQRLRNETTEPTASRRIFYLLRFSVFAPRFRFHVFACVLIPELLLTRYARI